MPFPWICVQLGAREHYAIARALHRSGNLEALMTDAWIKPGNLLGTLHRGLGERYHPDLAATPVISSNTALLAFEIAARARKLTGWTLTMERNRWFQARVVDALSSFPERNSVPPILFAYSYAALEPLRVARKRGWKTVLGQIDPGPVEERLVGELHRRNPGIQSAWAPAPNDYWRTWREECQLANHIVVNSSWSRTALVEEGIEKEKITVVPLTFEDQTGNERFERRYPQAFTRERPLRVLFLGQVNLRKGIVEIMEAMRLLKDSPIEFTIVGQPQVVIPAELKSNPRIRWIGAVPRGRTQEYYRQADVFLFPTHSDGFGLTQLEAQAWKLPIIASRFCGEVVEHGRDGWLLPEVSGPAIAGQLVHCMEHPEILVAAAASSMASKYSFDAIGTVLRNLTLT